MNFKKKKLKWVCRDVIFIEYSHILWGIGKRDWPLATHRYDDSLIWTTRFSNKRIVLKFLKAIANPIPKSSKTNSSIFDFLRRSLPTGEGVFQFLRGFNEKDTTWGLHWAPLGLQLGGLIAPTQMINFTLQLFWKHCLVLTVSGQQRYVFFNIRAALFC